MLYRQGKFNSSPKCGLPRWLGGKDSACQCRIFKKRGFDPWVGKIPWSRKWQPTPVSLTGKSHGQRNLVGCSPLGCKELGTTKRPTLTLSLITSLVAQLVKNLPAMQETWVPSWVGKMPWKRKWQPTPVSLHGKSHGQRSLVSCSPLGCKELGTTEQLTLNPTLSF